MKSRGRVDGTVRRAATAVFLVSCVVIASFPGHTAAPTFRASVTAPIVSILMPTYNKGKYIARAVRSAIAQTLPNFELLIADDCSDDSTLTNLTPFLASEPRIRYWINDKRLFTNTNRVRLVHSSRASWLLSLDSDDELMNQTAEIDYATQLRTGADIVEHKAMQIDEGNHLLPWVFKPPPFKEADNETLTKAFLNDEMNWTLWLKMIRRLLYTRALQFLGREVCEIKNALGQDKVHLSVMYRFVRKYVTVDYYGYLYYRNVPENSWNRSPNHEKDLDVVEKLILAQRWRPITDPL
jgi:glycosyltransferase involved in cell wall biosynthesis